jgi:hypothetical protein
MSQKRNEKQFRHRIGPRVSGQETLHQYESAFRRWLGRELWEGRISNQQAAERFKIPYQVIAEIGRQYVPGIVFLKPMTQAEKQQLEELQKRLKLLEKQLEEATIKNIALETLVDVAEQKLKIPIRKKPGAKQ